MGDNELIEEVVSPTESQSVDLSSIIDSLNDLIVAQGEIIKNQKKIIDYFIPTEEELIQLEKDKQEELEQIEIQEKEIQEKEELKEQQLNDYNAQILTLLEDIKNNSSVGNEVASVSSSTNYSILLVIIFVLFIGLMYKAIRAFI